MSNDKDPASQFAKALKDAGLLLDGPPITNGAIHNVPVIGDKGKETSGAYMSCLNRHDPHFVIINTRISTKAFILKSGESLPPEHRYTPAKGYLQKLKDTVARSMKEQMGKQAAKTISRTADNDIEL